MLLDFGVRPKDLRKFSFDSIETGPKRDVYFGLPKVREDINGNEYRREDNNDLSNGRTNTTNGIIAEKKRLIEQEEQEREKQAQQQAQQEQQAMEQQQEMQIAQKN